MRRNGWAWRGRALAREGRSSSAGLGLGVVLGLAFVLCAATACVYAPYAPRDRGSLAPQGESEPVVDAPHNPLDSHRVVDVVCSPQGQPIIDTPESRECEADEDCELVCGDGIGEY